MADVCEIRPRKTRDGVNLTCGSLALWYLEQEQAVNYANNCLRGFEVIVYDAAGEVVQRIAPRTTSNSLSSW